MNAHDYNATNVRILMLCQEVEELPLLEMAEAQAVAEAVGPFMDPTLYRSKAAAFHVDMERVRILRKAQVSLATLRKANT